MFGGNHSKKGQWFSQFLLNTTFSFKKAKKTVSIRPWLYVVVALLGGDYSNNFVWHDKLDKSEEKRVGLSHRSSF